MFGGLSIKETDDNTESPTTPTPAQQAPETTASSGFSFLQTGAPTAATPTTPNDVISAEQPQLESASVTTSATTSGFDFMSGSGSGDNNTATTTTQDNDTVLKPRTNATQPSMFAGLNTASADTAAAKTTTADVSGESEAPVSSSGFSFLSTPVSPAAPPQQIDETTTNNKVDTPGSSFGFMNSMASSSSAGSEIDKGATVDSIGGEVDGGVDSSKLPVEKQESSSITATQGSEGISSGFSFLGGAGSTAATAAPSSIEVATPPTQQQKTLSSLVPETSTTTNNTPTPQSDLLSISNASLPTGSGVSWGAPSAAIGGGGGSGIVAKKVVKKKRGKRVGVGSAAATQAAQQQQQLPDPMASQSMTNKAGNGLPPPIPNHNINNSNNLPQMPSTPSHGGNMNQQQLPDSPPMRIKAERATNAAEEFIREKQMKQQQQQQSAIALAAERAMQDKGNMQRSDSSGSGGGGGWKMNNVVEAPKSPNNDDTYAAAKAAAEEAKKLDHGSANKGMGGKTTSLFSTFFNRSKSGSSSANNGGGISSHSSHGGVVVSPTPSVGKPMAFQRGGSSGSATNSSSPMPPTKEKLEIASYGTPRTMEDEQEQHDDNYKTREEMEIYQEQERQRIVNEQRQIAEHRAKAEEKALAEQQRRRKEEEDRLEQQRIEAEKQRAPRDKMKGILDHLADAARTATDDVSRLREARTKLIQDKLVAEKAERYAAQQLKFAETQQTVAAEEEDFEAADRLGTVIESHLKEKDKQSKICSIIVESIAKLDAEKEDAAKAVAGCFKDVQTKLAELKDEVDNKFKGEEVISQFATTSKRLSSESERLANDLKHIERDEKVLAEEEKELSELIGEETKSYDDKNLEASTKLEEVNKTIDDLRQQLAKAEAEAADLNKEISSYNTIIENIKSKYSRQTGRLEKKAQSVKEARADWTSEKESIEKAKNAHEAVVAAHSEEMVTREKLIEDIKAETLAAVDLEEIVTFHSTFNDEKDTSTATTNGEDGDDSISLDGEVLKYEAVVNEAKENVVAAETNITNLQEELSAIELQVPVLEELKKTAASKRDFKSAGKASKDIKSALARKEECQAELKGEAREREKFAKDELEKVTAILDEKKKVADERGREAGLKEMDRLRKKITQLKEIMKKFVKDDTDGGEEDSMSVSVVGAFVIESQIFILEAEGVSLGNKYGGWETLDDGNDSVTSAPTFDSEEDDEDIVVIDEEMVNKYTTLSSEIRKLEEEIDQAATDEDYEKAAELEEKVQSLRDEFKEQGFGSSKFVKALSDFNEKGKGSSASDDKIISDNEDSSPTKVIDDDVLDKYKCLCSNVKALEGNIEDAVANEEYEKADQLEQELKTTRADIVLLGFSIVELEEALKKTRNVVEDSVEENKEGVDEKIEESEDIVEESKEGDSEEKVDEKVEESDDAASPNNEEDDCEVEVAENDET